MDILVLSYSTECCFDETVKRKEANSFDVPTKQKILEHTWLYVSKQDNNT